ncbi:MAG: hypothetical protein K5665_02565 [Saccharofermentans sp.]|nr:hypothetical protein [Saccharofermentans sp.]
MNSNQRNLDFSGTELEQYSDNTILEVMHEKTDDEIGSRYVLIKHDYYSSDSDHGRELLSAFLSALCNSSYTSIVVYLIDTGTLLLEDSNPLYEEFLRLSGKAEMVIAPKESLDQYGIILSSDIKVETLPAGSISEDLICIPNLLILE